MEVEVKLPKGVGASIGNTLRQFSMRQLPAWRPVALKLNRAMNVINASSDIIEDMISITSNITSLSYVEKQGSTGTFVKEVYTFNRQLKASGLKSEVFHISGDENVLITSTDDREVVLTIIYRLASGHMTSADNIEFLSQQGENVEEYYALESQHSDLNYMVAVVEERGWENEVLRIKLESDTRDEYTMLVDSTKKLIEEMQNFLQIVENKSDGQYTELSPVRDRKIGIAVK